MTHQRATLQFLPPHLREVCAILAAGLVRLRSRAIEDIERDRADDGETSLHFLGSKSVCATRINRRVA